MQKQFFTAKSFDEAMKLKKEHGERAKYLCGGTELNTRVNKPYYDVLIDIGNLVSHEVKWSDDGKIYSIGAGATFEELYKDEKVVPQIRRAAGHMSTTNIRKMATIGGNIGAGSTVGDFITTLFVLDAKVKVHGSDELISVEDYVLGKMDVPLITEILITKENLDKNYNSATYRRVQSDFSIIGAAATYTLDGDKYTNVKIAVGGMGPKVMRAKEVEALLEGKKLTKDEVVELMKEKVRSRDSLLRGTAEFRGHIAAVLTAESLGLIK